MNWNWFESIVFTDWVCLLRFAIRNVSRSTRCDLICILGGGGGGSFAYGGNQRARPLSSNGIHFQWIFNFNVQYQFRMNWNCQQRIQWIIFKWPIDGVVHRVDAGAQWDWSDWATPVLCKWVCKWASHSSKKKTETKIHIRPVEGVWEISRFKSIWQQWKGGLRREIDDGC